MGRAGHGDGAASFGPLPPQNGGWQVVLNRYSSDTRVLLGSDFFPSHRGPPRNGNSPRKPAPLAIKIVGLPAFAGAENSAAFAFIKGRTSLLSSSVASDPNRPGHAGAGRWGRSPGRSATWISPGTSGRGTAGPSRPILECGRSGPWLTDLWRRS